MANISPLSARVAEIKSAIADCDMTLREKQDLCGVPITTLRMSGRSDWNPTLETLLRLEAAFCGKKKRKGN